MSDFDHANPHQFSYDPVFQVCYRTLDFLGVLGYRVGDDGSVWSRKLRGSRTGTLTNKWTKIVGYKNNVSGYVSVYSGTPGGDWYVHYLVLVAFVGPRPEWMVALHDNDVPDDNRLCNLSWGTRQRNIEDSIRNGGWPIGEQRTQSKLTDEMVRLIKIGLRDRVPKSHLAAKFGVSISAITQIQKGLAWRHVL